MGCWVPTSRKSPEGWKEIERSISASCRKAEEERIVVNYTDNLSFQSFFKLLPAS